MNTFEFSGKVAANSDSRRAKLLYIVDEIVSISHEGGVNELYL